MDDPKCRKRTLDTIRNYHRGVSSLTDTGELFVGPVLDVTGTREREREREREDMRRDATAARGTVSRRARSKSAYLKKKVPFRISCLSSSFLLPLSLSLSLALRSLSLLSYSDL